jgi:hypothetical protein
LRLDRNDYALAEFMDYLRAYCGKRNAIHAFEGFTDLYFLSDRGFINFEHGKYTHDMVSQALIHEDLDGLFKMRYYIRGLFNGLEQIEDNEDDDNSNNEQNSDEDCLMTYYRGQIMARSEFNKMRKNKTAQIMFNKFLWTTSDFDAAAYDASSFVRISRNLVPVIFEITVDTSLSYPTSFKRIERFSLFPLNDEVVFSANSVFDIVGFEKNSKVWMVQLNLSTQENDEKWKVLSACV